MKYAIYSDGSYKNGIWEAGAVILQETPFGFNPVQELSFFGEDADGIRNVAGEIYGVLEALRLLFKINQSSRDVDSVTVYHAVIHYREEQTSHVTEENSVQETEMPELATSVSRAE